MPSIRRDLEKRAQDAILSNIIENYKKNREDWRNNPEIRTKLLTETFFSPLNAALIGGTILSAGFFLVLGTLLLGPLALLLGALIPVGGLAVEAFLLYNAATNDKAHAQAVADMLRPQVEFDPRSIKDRELREKVEQALEYWSLIDDTIEETPEGAIRERLENTTREVTHWLQAVYNLAHRVEEFQGNSVIRRDLETVPESITDNKAKLALEDSPEVRKHLQRTIEDQERQLRTLKNLEDSMETASYQLDSTISSLGTIYSQLLLVGSKDESGSKVDRLQGEISEQVHRLEDLTEAMDEVYHSSY
jgi:phage shock protein A